MKHLWPIILVIWGIFHISYASDSNSFLLRKELTIELPEAISPHILHSNFLENGDFAFLYYDNSDPQETFINTLILDLKGKIHSSHKFGIQHATHLKAFSHKGKVVVGWVETGILADQGDRLWMAELKGAQWQKKLLMETPKAGELTGKSNPADLVGVDLEPTLLGEWWLFKVGSTQKLFVRKTGYKWIHSEDEFDLSHSEWLYCYQMNDNVVTFEGKTGINENYDLACSVVDNEIFIWQTVSEKERAVDTLRVAVWNNEGKFKWTNCYTGNKPLSFSFDSMHGSAVMVHEWKNPVRGYGILCLVQATNPTPIPMGSHFGGGGQIGQLLHIPDVQIAWAAMFTSMTKDKMVIITLDKDLHAMSNVLPKSLDTNCHLLYNKGHLYVAELMRNKLIIKRL